MEKDHSGPTLYYEVQYDLSNCDKEPIHIIRVVQDHACLIGADPQTFQTLHVSDNSEQMLGVAYQQLLAGKLTDFLGDTEMEQISIGLRSDDFLDINPIILTEFAGKRLPQAMNLVVHLQQQTLILELEQRDAEVSSSRFLQRSDRAVQRIQSSPSLSELFLRSVEEIKALTGYDRVMLYQFDQDHNGTVIAEAKEDHLEPFYMLRYPATDIPQQARALFLKNQVRIIVDTESTPSWIWPSLDPRNQQPLDLTDSVARGVSPLHIEYLTNMGVRGTMSVSVVVDDQLWGLIACHHYQPKLIDFRLRNMIKFLGRIISGHLGLQEAYDFREQTLKANLIRSHLFEQMTQDWDILEGLLQKKHTLLDLNSASGAALLLDGKVHTIGKCPPVKTILELATWLTEEVGESVFQTNCLSKHWPPAMAIKDEASGLLAIQIAYHPAEYIMWFRPEVIQTVHWAGNPEKAVAYQDGQVRLSPRQSFEQWKQLVENTATPWAKHDVTVAIALRNDIKEIIIQKYQEIRQLNKDLLEAYEDLESFSYSVSHDLRAPLRTIEGFSQILQEDYEDKFDEYGKHVLQNISSSVGKMNAFINDLLSLSKLSRTELIINDLDLEYAIREQWESYPEEVRQKYEFRLKGPLPRVQAEITSLQQLLQNLISNAIKYSRHHTEPRIEVGGYSTSKTAVFYVKDNGIGFDPKYVGRIFEMFSRLVNESEYEGTGVGLAIVKKVMDKHNGRIWAESAPGKGAVFYCEFPVI